MTGILCVWAADFTESSERCYENDHIPGILSRCSGTALLAETIETPLDKEFEGVGTRDPTFKSLTVYEVTEVQKIVDATYDISNHPLLGKPLQETRFDVRAYDLVKSWQFDKDWTGGTCYSWS